MRLAFALTLLTASLLVSTLSSGTVRAQGKYPDRTVKIVVPYPAGADIPGTPATAPVGANLSRGGYPHVY